jgi:hypothetical protein
LASIRILGITLTPGQDIKEIDEASAADQILKPGQMSIHPQNLFTAHKKTRFQNSINKIGFGLVTKLALKFVKAFWDVDSQYFGMATKPKGR